MPSTQHPAIPYFYFLDTSSVIISSVEQLSVSSNPVLLKSESNSESESKSSLNNNKDPLLASNPDATLSPSDSNITKPEAPGRERGGVRGEREQDYTSNNILSSPGRI